MDNGREFTFRAVILGILIGLVFGAASAFLGLKVGMTVSASIPAAVISMAVLRGLFRSGSILENNLVQTIGSAGTAVASGVVFTVPALFIMGISPDYWTIAVWAAIGGTLGVLFMIPLRHYLIVKEHGRLRYPEGLACAEVLEAGQRGGGLAKTVFWGMGISCFYEILRGLGFWRNIATVGVSQMRTKATLDASPALLGVGYIIGPRISAYMLSGAVLGWFVLIPAVSFFGSEPFGPILEQSAVSISPAPAEERSNRAVLIPDGRSEGSATALICFETTQALDSTSSGLSIELPDTFDLGNVKIGGITAGNRVYSARQRIDGQTLTLDRFDPPVYKTSSTIQPGWIDVVLHAVSGEGDTQTAFNIQTYNAPQTPLEQIEIVDISRTPSGQVLVASTSQPGANQVTAVVTYTLKYKIANDKERIALDLSQQYDMGYFDAKQHRQHPVNVVSLFDGSTVYDARASVLEDATGLSVDLKGPLLMTSEYSPSPTKKEPIPLGMVTLVLHGLSNKVEPSGSDEIEAMTISSPGTKFPSTMPITEMSVDQIHSKYIKYVGAGAVAIGGLLSLLKSFPTIFGSMWHLFVAMFAGKGGDDRTTRDLPFILVAGGVVAVVALLWNLPWLETGWQGAILVCVFGFFFVTVSSRLVGEIGSSSNPTSGMTIATLLGTSLLFLYASDFLFGVVDTQAIKITALSVGAIVCIAIAVAGDCSQDLKTGYLVKATPWKQQIGELIGVLTAALCVAGVIFLLHKGYGFTEDRPNALKAPQANLMAMLLDGVFDGNLPWLFIGIGIAAGLVVEFMGIGCLPFAVGLYLPLALSVPIMIGGLIRLFVDRVHRNDTSSGHDAGVLGASGLVAGEGLVGVGLGGVTAFCAWMWPHRDISCQEVGPSILQFVDLDIHYELAARWYDLLPLAPFGLLVMWLLFTALRRAIPDSPPSPDPYPKPEASYAHRLPSFQPGEQSNKPRPIQIPPPSPGPPPAGA
ncbi:MAG: oligopeptide transporter, OPT family [Planctomycetes bacterium]|nr:oligopeptide transporter, OPT family [Planctomycetota bacterium]